MSIVTCPSCGSNIPSGDDYCNKCGFHRPADMVNYCTNPTCERYEKPVSESVNFCGKCGKPTLFGNILEDLT